MSTKIKREAKNDSIGDEINYDLYIILLSMDVLTEWI